MRFCVALACQKVFGKLQNEHRQLLRSAASGARDALQVSTGGEPQLERPGARRGPHRRLHERPRHDLQHGRPHDARQVVRLGGHHVLLCQLRQLAHQRRYQADPEQLHALHLCGGDVVPAEPGADEAALGDALVRTCLPCRLEASPDGGVWGPWLARAFRAVT